MISEQLLRDCLNTLVIGTQKKPQGENPTQTVREYLKQLQGWSERDLRSVTDWLVQNYEGWSFPRISDFNNARSAVLRARQSGEPITRHRVVQGDEKYVSGPELIWYWKCFFAILELHRRKVQYNGQRLRKWLPGEANWEHRLDKWMQDGCPTTGSPVYDDMQRGSWEAYQLSIKQKGDYLERYYREYLESLKNYYPRQLGGTIEPQTIKDVA